MPLNKETKPVLQKIPRDLMLYSYNMNLKSNEAYIMNVATKSILSNQKRFLESKK